LRKYPIYIDRMHAWALQITSKTKIEKLELLKVAKGNTNWTYKKNGTLVCNNRRKS